MPASELRHQWRTGITTYGLAFRLASTWTVEAAINMPLDFLWFDLQHGFISHNDLLTMLQTMNGSSAAALVRVSENHPVDIGRALDAGADGIIVPMIESAEDARRAVAACRFGPGGLRSNGALRLQFLGGVKREVLCLVMIETLAGVENVDEILTVDGVDGVFIGPSDLALSMGLSPAGIQDGPHAEAIETVVTACRSAGAVACITGNGKTMREQGFGAVSIGADHLFFESGLRAALENR